MKCPVCGNEMQIGKVESKREIMWIKEGERKETRISSRLFLVSNAYAERCEDCGVVVIKEQ